MEKNYTAKKVLQAYLLFFMIITTNMFAQVGIGTTSPAASSILDLTSTTQGLLTPRMTTAQRIAIASPADGLMVYDTDLKSFYHFDSGITSWDKINTDANYGRIKFKRIKSTDVLATVLAAEKTAGGGSKYLLDTYTLYEINGTVTVDFPIELNNAYVIGQDSGEDKLVKASGDLFTGTTGGSIRVLTLTATSGNVFNIAGGGTQNLVFRDAIVVSSSNVGVIDNFSLVFVSIVQFIGNTTGITYKDVSKLLISNVGWFGNNLGTFETFQGTFGLIQKQGGFSEVNTTSIGFDVSSNPTITGSAVLRDVIFTGTLSTGKYVNGYTTGSYAGYNFNNKWMVNAPGIPREDDASAVGEFSVDYPVGSGASTAFSGPPSTPTSILKVAGTSTSSNLFRFSTGSPAVSNKLIYEGNKKRYFQVTGSISFQVPAVGTYIIYVAKNGTPVTQYKIYGRGTAASDIVVLPINALVELSNSDYVEIFAQRYTTSNNGDSIITPNMTLVVK
ncbi:hypothetical protein IWX84_001418 [Flavobacterium sp. CG_9.10]|uniref:hypothetical protein n=1 Tax=Flavobacterium sp. CG_9.10 TaxID=2787729 RepID=UPI0018CAB199|nr:hypothetical protein [Flavobacterium sp. CG_9.10]MBG6110539.1 hypothetical protein [Flavobacterium sp. CG_9.10]